MGLKGYRLWVMGQLDSNVQSPTPGVSATLADGPGRVGGVVGLCTLNQVDP
jgi:hypothetical protein